MLDPKLCWNEHSSYVSKRLASQVYLLRNLRAVVSEEVLLMAYHALMGSVLHYGILAWGHAPAAQDIFAMQRRAIRVIAGVGYRACCRRSFTALKIMTVPSIYIMECLRYTKQNIESFSTRFDTHGRDTRSRHHVNINLHRVNASRCGRTFFGPKLFNLLPTNIKMLPTKEFLSCLKKYLTEMAFYSIQECLDCKFVNLKT